MRFADTSFWYALQDRSDTFHPAAAAMVAGGSGRIVTSNNVVGETWTLLRRRGGHVAALGFLDRVTQLVAVEMARIDAELEADAWKWLRRHNERNYSFVDATSFALMRRRRIREALTFEGDFAAAGFIEVRPA